MLAGRSIDEMRGACDVLGYEYGTFQDAALLGMLATRDGNGGQRNVALAAIVLHLRNLLDFFYVEDRKGTSAYVLAEHFAADASTWRAARARTDLIEWGERDSAPITININRLVDLANTWASHLSWERVNDSQPTWHLRSLLLHMDKLIREFVERAEARLVTLVWVDHFELPPTPSGIAALVGRYRTARYSPQLIQRGSVPAPAP